MPDADIKDFDPVTPLNNTTVKGVSIAQNATAVAQVDDAIRSVLSVVAAADFGTLSVKMDTIAESTAAAGVTIDGLLIKDGSIDFGVGGPSADIVSESTAAAGVTIDGVLLKDSNVTAAVVTATGNSVFQANLQAQGQAYSPLHTLTAGASISWDLDTGNAATVTLNTASSTLNAATNQQAGGIYIVIVNQGVGGGRALTFNSNYLFPNGVAPSLTQSSNAIDIFSFISTGTVMLNIGQLYDLS